MEAIAELKAKAFRRRMRTSTPTAVAASSWSRIAIMTRPSRVRSVFFSSQ